MRWNRCADFPAESSENNEDSYELIHKSVIALPDTRPNLPLPML